MAAPAYPTAGILVFSYLFKHAPLDTDVTFVLLTYCLLNAQKGLFMGLQNPSQLPVSTEAHPRLADYSSYVAAMQQLRITALSFHAWLESTEGCERVFQVTAPGFALTPGWYKSKFAPHHRLIATCGPFQTRTDALTA